ncbi:Tegument antigen [Fasciola gigantica]|uniref:Tegument antigen n=1 Tax=Fasciola gigantica TaxID=46835 RepID=A0A504YFG3_FASGI|nr:Tegument antigen [Fasciola gigantica]
MTNCSADLEKMIDLFLSLDKNEDGAVSMDELKAACEEKKLNMKEVQTWLARYDKNKDGTITLDEFCDGLGLNNNEMTVEKDERDYSKTAVIPKVDKSIKVIDCSMSDAKKAAITDQFIALAKEVSNNPKQMSNVATKLKRFLEGAYGQVWHVVIVSGSYWMNYSHAPLFSMQFQHGPFVCVVWRTGSV